MELLSRGRASPRSLDESNANALHLTARNGHVEVAEFVLALKISIHDTDSNGFTPIQLAVIGSHFSAVDFLLRKNVAVNKPCREGWTPPHYACSSHNPDLVRLLLSAGADPQARIPGDGRRPIHIAAGNGSVEIVEILNQKRVSLSTRDLAGDRPLCIACHYGHTDVAEKLLELGEHLRVKLRYGPNEDSPLCVAANCGHVEVIRLLIRKGASVKQRDEYWYIALRYAAYYGHPDALRLLLEEGAELVDDGEDSKGWGFVLTPDMVGFAEDSDISDDRKRQVHELLDEAERNMNQWEIEDIGFRSQLVRGPTRHLLGSQSKANQELLGSSPRTELPSLNLFQSQHLLPHGQATTLHQSPFPTLPENPDPKPSHLPFQQQGSPRNSTTGNDGTLPIASLAPETAPTLSHELDANSSGNWRVSGHFHELE